jgi:hypothetical protein
LATLRFLFLNVFKVYGFGELRCKLKMIILSCLVIAQRSGDSKVFRPCVEDDLGWLAVWCSEEYGSDVKSIILGFKVNSQLDLVLQVSSDLGVEFSIPNGSGMTA